MRDLEQMSERQLRQALFAYSEWLNIYLDDERLSDPTRRTVEMCLNQLDRFIEIATAK